MHNFFLILQNSVIQCHVECMHKMIYVARMLVQSICKRYRLSRTECTFQTFLRSGRSKGGDRPPIDWMHLKTCQNFARKCIIFA